MTRTRRLSDEIIAQAIAKHASGQTWESIATSLNITPTGLRWYTDDTFRAKTMAARKKYYEGNKARVKKSILLAGVKHGIKTGLFTKQEAIDFINGLTFPVPEAKSQ